MSSWFKYLNRASEFANASAGFMFGDPTQAGLEAKASFNDYSQETILNDNWRGRVGSFVEAAVWEGIKPRAGGGFHAARYDTAPPGGSDYKRYYSYARTPQETRLFSHSVDAG